MATYLKKRIDQTVTDAIDAKVRSTVEGIMTDIKKRGDAAVRDLSTQFDKWSPPSFKLSPSDIEAIMAKVKPETIADIKFAQAQIRNFAQHQRAALKDIEVETLPGVKLGHKNIPVDSVGCYVPGGRYPMVASAHMSIVTARTAGVRRVIACTPPNQGEPHAETIAAMVLAGADEIYVLGGVQAIVAMALGTETIAPVDMLCGPGNAYVAEAKRQLFGRVGIDLLAGPSEVAIIADDTADPEIVAADLLGQAEHGPQSPASLVTTSRSLADKVIHAVDQQLQTLETEWVAGPAWRDYGTVYVVDTPQTAVEVMDLLAPEHLEIITSDDDWYYERLKNYGSIFLGPWSTVAYSDKGSSGTNHVLPTGTGARYSAGLSVSRFLKPLTYQRSEKSATEAIAKYVDVITEYEGMAAHRATATMRLDRL